MFSNKSIFEESRFSREQSMDVLRILACMGVLFVHSAAMCFAIGVVENGSFMGNVCCAMKQVLKISVPVFAMLTGYFFLNSKKEFSLKKLYGKKILRLVIALVFWALFNAVTIHGRYYPFGGQDTNFWYVGMCIGLYVSMPVLRCIADNEKLLAYSCWTWFFIQIYCYIGRYVEVPIAITDYVFVEFMGYCLWGNYLSRLGLSRKQTRFVYSLGFLAVVAMFAISFCTNGRISFDYTDLCPMLTVFAVFLFFVKHPLNLSSKWEGILAHFSKATFGIYMAHSFVVVEAFSRIYRFVPNPIMLVLVATFAIFIMSYIIVFVIMQIPILKKWVV